MAVNTVRIAGKDYVILERNEYDRLATLAKSATLPPPDAKGNFPAVEYARASIARGDRKSVV